MESKKIMLPLAHDSVWRERLGSMDSQVDSIRMPFDDFDIGQGDERCEVVVDKLPRVIRFHDYSEIFKVPGLYEELFYDILQCCSPNYVVSLLEGVMREIGEKPESLRVIDVGAGNGMVGDELTELGVASVVGLDIIPEAKSATMRDRPGIYSEFHIADLTNLPESTFQELRQTGANCLSTVAALGFEDISALAFARAIDLVETPGWLAFSLKEDFLCEDDSTGFHQLMRQLNQLKVIQTYSCVRYRHRISIEGVPLFYLAVIAKKVKELDRSIFSSLTE